MPPSIFLSSTFSDLQLHRQLVREAIVRLEYDSQAMEFFGALPDTPKQECLRLVRSANAYVGIFAMRYGHVDPESGKSMTQLEYEEAQVIRLPTLIYIIDEESHAVLPKHVETDSPAEKLRELKRTLQASHVVSFFSSPEDLASKVTQDLVRLFGAMGKKPTAQVLSQLAANAVNRHPLTPPRFEYLKQRISGTFSSSVADAVLKEALELLIAGDRMAAAFLLSRGAPMPLDEATDALMAIDKVLIDLIQKNRAGAEQ